MMIANVTDPTIKYDNGDLSWDNANIDFILLSITPEILNATQVSYQSKDQRQFKRFQGWTVTSFSRQTNVSYTRDSKGIATANYSEELYFDKYNNLLYFQNDKRKEELDYNYYGSLVSQKNQSLSDASQNILNEWDYENNHLSAARSYYLADKIVTTMNYNDMGSMTKQTDPNGFETKYNYYAYGTKLQDVDFPCDRNTIFYSDDKVRYLMNYGVRFYFTYNKEYPSMVSSISLGNPNESQEYLYAELSFTPYSENGRGDEYSTDYANGQSIRKTYNQYNELIRMYCDGKECDLTYSNQVSSGRSASGNVNSQRKLTKINDQSVDMNVSFGYNSYGDVSTITKECPYGTFTQNFEYDNRRRLSSQSYKYDAVELPPITPPGRAVNEDDDQSIKVSYTYETGNNANQYNIKRVRVEFPDGQSLRYDIYKDDLDRLVDMDIYFGTSYLFAKHYEYSPVVYSDSQRGTTGLIHYEDFYLNNELYKGISYIYDKNGNIINIKHDNKETKFTYDSENKLLVEENSRLGKMYTYTYDAMGNILSKTVSNMPSYDSSTTIKYEYDYKPFDRLKKWNGIDITYDECGNPTSYKGHTLTWTRGRLLNSFGSVFYEYDYTGTRTFKRHGSYRYTYVTQNGNLLSEEIANLTEHYTNYYFYNQSGLFGAVIKGVVYYYVKDFRGDILEIRRFYR